MAIPDRIYFLADMHLKPLDAPNAHACELAARDNDRLADFLASIAGKAASLVLLGDTFNFWFERRGRVMGDYLPALRLFKAAADKGLDIHHVSGNRDFVVGEGITLDPTSRFSGFFRYKKGFTVSRLCDYGIEPHGPRYRFHHAGKTIGCIHGDALCTGDHLYMLLRHVLQGWIGRTTMRYSPWFLAKAIFSRQQGRTSLRSRGKTPEKLFSEKVIWREMAMGADLLLCGHIHTHHERTIQVTDRTCRLVAIPAWLDGGYAYLSDGTLHVRTDG